MSHTFARARLADRLRRVMAATSAALVFALTIFAASPVAHAWLHHGDLGHDHVASESAAPSTEVDGCAVVLFANGVSLPVAPLAVLPPTAVPSLGPRLTGADLFLLSPRYLRQPERGPPASRID